MVDIEKYTTDEGNIEFVKSLYDCVEGQDERNLTYQGEFLFTFCPSGEMVFIHDGGHRKLGLYATLDDMLLNHLVDGKPFIEQVDYIDYED